MNTIRSWMSFAICLLVPVVMIAQSPKKANVWYFGEQAGLDFTNGHPDVITNGAMISSEGVSSLSDANGELLFYTNGGDFPFSGGIWNRNHQLMPNGDLTGAGGCNSSFQSSMIVNKPGSTNTYYMFTVDCQENGFADGLSYSIIDMTLDGGLGDVVVKGVNLTDNVNESIAAVKHTNGKDHWIITHKVSTDSFYVYHLSRNGIAGVVKSKIGPSAGQYAGELSISANAEKLAHHGTFFTALYDFNASTGKITNYTNLNQQSSFGGFSQNCQYLYVSNLMDQSIYQFDLYGHHISYTKTLIGTTTPDLPGAIQLGPNGRMYIAKNNSDHLAVIKDPNFKGTDCNFTSNGLYLEGKTSKMGLPNFANGIVGECVSYPVENTTTFDGKMFAKQVDPDKIELELPDYGTGNQFKIRTKAQGETSWDSHTSYTKDFVLNNLDPKTEYSFQMEAIIGEDYLYEFIYDHQFEEVVNHIHADGDALKVTTTGEFEFNIYPNPVRGAAKVDVNLGDITSDVELFIFDASGRLVYQEVMEDMEGFNSLNIPVEQLQNGVYNITISSTITSSSKRFVVMN